MERTVIIISLAFYLSPIEAKQNRSYHALNNLSLRTLALLMVDIRVGVKVV